MKRKKELSPEGEALSPPKKLLKKITFFEKIITPETKEQVLSIANVLSAHYFPLEGTWRFSEQDNLLFEKADMSRSESIYLSKILAPLGLEIVRLNEFEQDHAAYPIGYKISIAKGSFEQLCTYSESTLQPSDEEINSISAFYKFSAQQGVSGNAYFCLNNDEKQLVFKIDVAEKAKRHEIVQSLKNKGIKSVCQNIFRRGTDQYDEGYLIFIENNQFEALAEILKTPEDEITTNMLFLS